MSMFGLEVTATIAAPLDDSEAERIYTSLASNFAIKSIDMAIDAANGSIDFLLGVESPSFCEDHEEFVRGVAQDALHRAFNSGEPAGEADFSETQIVEFA